MGRDRSKETRVNFPEAFDRIVEAEDLALEHLSKINYTFWKPIESPIDLTVEVPAR